MPIIFPIVGAAKYFDDWGDRAARAGTRGMTSDDVALSGRRSRGREDPALDDLGARRMHALPLRRERHDVPLIHLNNDLTAEARQSRQVCSGRCLREGPQDRLTCQGRSADRVQRRLGRRRRDLPPPLRGTPERRRRRESSPVPERGTAASLPGATTPAKPVTIGVKGTRSRPEAASSSSRSRVLRVWPGGTWTTIPARSLELAVPVEAVLDESLVDLILSPTRRRPELSEGDEGRRLHDPDAGDARASARASPERSRSIGSALDESMPSPRPPLGGAATTRPQWPNEGTRRSHSSGRPA